MCDRRKMGMQYMEIRAFPVHTAYIPRRLYLGRDLPVFDIKGYLVRNDLPAQMMIQRDRIRIEKGKRPSLFLHMGKAFKHQLLHNTLSGVFRIGTDARYKPYLKNLSVNIHFQRIDRKLRDQGIPVKTAQYICSLQYREL